ncbi:hypothetical protein ABTC93_19960, partial [Acinetobacter baumannii]
EDRRLSWAKALWARGGENLGSSGVHGKFAALCPGARGAWPSGLEGVLEGRPWPGPGGAGPNGKGRGASLDYPLGA